MYHFWHYGTNEDRYFLDKVKKMGLDKTTWLALDVEAPDLPQKCTAGINKFLGYLYANGYHNLMVYGSASWFKEGRINQAKLHKYAKLWVAAYGTSQPGINHVDIWQYTDRFKGMSLDASYDFKNLLKSNGKSATPIKPEYYASKGLFEVKADMVHAYNKLPLKDDKNKRYVRFAKGSRFYGAAAFRPYENPSDKSARLRCTQGSVKPLNLNCGYVAWLSFICGPPVLTDHSPGWSLIGPQIQG